ncbi:hypothetical protein MPTK1_2g03780 [Marchantia polymorpha subsp. ruderalis]|uniref:Uncharacterized protein n=1 Tax=Marchantia polymorpha TaxID=3197 RepID=A0A2R6X7H4_MARPO|nr:hypothetical protein MARPO_0031s0034 [Marchantia polymorpha]BBN00994.1 hypothetical protein Mp_2g03780 [Marchantia polymorpha subsp. ruderalis]|eukprot:PTQ42043.1 hypothetical protein MARPO_0031s0034 [Marchantia polymorpha]
MAEVTARDFSVGDAAPEILLRASLGGFKFRGCGAKDQETDDTVLAAALRMSMHVHEGGWATGLFDLLWILSRHTFRQSWKSGTRPDFDSQLVVLLQPVSPTSADRPGPTGGVGRGSLCSSSQDPQDLSRQMFPLIYFRVMLVH